MKKLYFFAIVTLLMLLGPVYAAFSQAPEGFYYQAEARDNRGRLIANTDLTVNAFILERSTSGSSVWDKSYNVRTDKYGLFSIIIGNVEYDDEDFSSIAWGDGIFFLSVQIIYGTTTIQMPVTQLISVPYALYAKNAGSVGNETDPVFKTFPAFGISSGNITDWNTAYGWGNHAGLYRPMSYVPAWSEITGNPFNISVPSNNQLLKYNDATSIWENWTPDFITSYTESDPFFSGWDKNTGISISASQVSDFDTEVTNNPTVMVNTAKISYPPADASKLAGIMSGAEVNVNADWNASEGDAQILNKPAFSSVALSGIYYDLSGKPDLSIYATRNMADGNITDLANPVNAQDAATKDYVDLLESKVKALTNTVNAGGISEDIDGNIYQTVRIGTQIWMAENLKTTKLNDGTPIPEVMDPADWMVLSTEAYCWYNNDVNNKYIYGALYNYFTVNTGKLCPIGWHVPSDAEWATLITFLGGESVAGGKMKESGTSHWKSPNAGATNESGFSALPGGVRDGGDGYFYAGEGGGYWWSSTEFSTEFAWSRFLHYNIIDIFRYYDPKEHGSSVRCLRD